MAKTMKRTTAFIALGRGSSTAGPTKTATSQPAPEAVLAR